MAVVSAPLREYTVSGAGQAAYFYFVLALAKDGTPSPSFVAGKNMTGVAIATEALPPGSALGASAGSTQGATQITTGATGSIRSVSALAITATSDSVKLSFTISAGTGTVLIYRAPASFVDAKSLLDATLISTVPETTRDFVDFPVPGVGYYYGLLPESSLKAGNIEFKVGSNTTAQPVTIATSGLFGPLPETGILSRTTPLPSYVFGRLGMADTHGQAGTVTSETEKAISTILASFPLQRPLIPPTTILADDRGQPRGGEDYALSLILQGPFKKGDYAEAASQLEQYLSLNRSAVVASRAHFYLGQAFARTGAYRDSLFEFLKARDLHAVEARPWIRYVIAVLRG